MEAFLKAKGIKGARLRSLLDRLGHGDGSGVQLDALPGGDRIDSADLAWHVRAWGRWVLARARKELASCYPTYAEFEPLRPGREFEPRPMRLLEVDDAGAPQLDPLNAEFDEVHLRDLHNPRWVAKLAVAYLWARTVACKQCRAELPLLKTRWLCKKEQKRVLLTMEPKADQTGVVFGVQSEVPQSGGNGAQRREHDRNLGAGYHVAYGCGLPLLRRHRDHGGHPLGRSGRTVGCGDDVCGCGWAEREGIPPAHGPRAGRGGGDRGSAAGAVWGYSLRLAGGASAQQRGRHRCVRVLSRWTAMASTRGGSCSRIGSLQALGEFVRALNEVLRAACRLAIRIEHESIVMTCACRSSAE